VDPVLATLWSGVGGAVVGLVAGTVGSGGDSLAFWTAALVLVTLGLVGVTARYAKLLRDQATEQLRPFLVWDCYYDRDDEYGILVRNAGRTAAKVTEARVEGFDNLEALIGRQIGPQSKCLLVRFKKNEVIESLGALVQVGYRGPDRGSYSLEDRLNTIFTTFDFRPRLVSRRKPKA
jgi:hypothetical protein